MRNIPKQLLFLVSFFTFSMLINGQSTVRYSKLKDKTETSGKLTSDLYIVAKKFIFDDDKGIQLNGHKIYIDAKRVKLRKDVLVNLDNSMGSIIIKTKKFRAKNHIIIINNTSGKTIGESIIQVTNERREFIIPTKCTGC